MTYADWNGMAEKRQTRPRERLGWFLRQHYAGPGRDKRLARDLELSPRTARNLFEDHWPSDDTWAAIARRFGDEVLRVVFAPEIAPVLAEITEREARLARELEGLRARRREVQGLVEDRPHRLDASPEEAPGPLNLDLFEGRMQ